MLYKTVGGSVVGYGGSYDPEGITEVSLTLDDDDTDKMASVLWDTLKRYCPKGTYLEKYARESLDDEKDLLFEVGEDPASEPLPVADRKFAYISRSRLNRGVLNAILRQ